MKVAICIAPICTALVEPGWVTVTTPSVPIVSDCAFCGTVIAGSTW